MINSQIQLKHEAYRGGGHPTMHSSSNQSRETIETSTIADSFSAVSSQASQFVPSSVAISSTSSLIACPTQSNNSNIGSPNIVHSSEQPPPYEQAIAMPICPPNLAIPITDQTLSLGQSRINLHNFSPASMPHRRNKSSQNKRNCSLHNETNNNSSSSEAFNCELTQGNPPTRSYFNFSDQDYYTQPVCQHIIEEHLNSRLKRDIFLANARLCGANLNADHQYSPSGANSRRTKLLRGENEADAEDGFDIDEADSKEMLFRANFSKAIQEEQGILQLEDAGEIFENEECTEVINRNQMHLHNRLLVRPSSQPNLAGLTNSSNSVSSCEQTALITMEKFRAHCKKKSKNQPKTSDCAPLYLQARCGQPNVKIQMQQREQPYRQKQIEAHADRKELLTQQKITGLVLNSKSCQPISASPSRYHSIDFPSAHVSTNLGRERRQLALIQKDSAGATTVIPVSLSTLGSEDLSGTSIGMKDYKHQYHLLLQDNPHSQSLGQNLAETQAQHRQTQQQLFIVMEKNPTTIGKDDILHGEETSFRGLIPILRRTDPSLPWRSVRDGQGGFTNSPSERPIGTNSTTV
ncbi:unnamed protein product [Protopolystoma xenopodis]|uniref:Uncharacterized protein n=1 Tax=Protopolystoma xenopodis TaxID=117903 RepID=A0A448WHB4_9PLAT|nr:unnamed protein product [Protopolystoma xenopodis]